MDRPIVHALTDAASEALFTGVRGREILGSPGRSESQQLVSDSCNKRSIRGVAKGQKCLCPTCIGLGTGPCRGDCYRELPRIPLMGSSSLPIQIATYVGFCGLHPRVRAGKLCGDRVLALE